MTSPNIRSVASTIPNVAGDGIHDDTPGLQAALDTNSPLVYLPPPPARYLIRRTLLIHSNQTLLLDRHTTIRLADNSNVPMLANADPVNGNSGISVIGGIWDANNAGQTVHDFSESATPYNPNRWIGVAMRFNRVSDLRIANLTIKDPESFGIQTGDIQRFTFDDITFDYNLLRGNMDGLHLHGPCRQGRITNIKGTTNDDLVALNADDGPIAEMTRGPISDIQIDGLFAENGYTAVRLLSAGSPIRNIRISNLFGTYRYHVVSFTHHEVHPGQPSTFDNILVDGVFCRKPDASADKLPSDEWARLNLPLIWLQSGTSIGTLQIRNLLRTETVPEAPDTMIIEPNATIDYLTITDASLSNHTQQNINLLTNRGTIRHLTLSAIRAQGTASSATGAIIQNTGNISHLQTDRIATDNYHEIAPNPTS